MHVVATLRAWLAQQGIKTIIPACAQRTNSQPHASERYLARHAMEQGIGWLNAWSPAMTNMRSIS